MTHYIRFAHKKIQRMTKDGKPELLSHSEKRITEYCEYNKWHECYATYMRYDEKDQENSGLTAPLVFDLDSKRLEVARDEAIKVIKYFEDTLDITPHVYFSGNKGFHIIIDETAFDLKPRYYLIDVHKILAKNLKTKLQLNTLDLAIYDRKRLLRLPNTKHADSGLYKTLLTKEQLEQPVKKTKEYCGVKRDTKPKPHKLSSKLHNGYMVTESAFLEKSREIKTMQPTLPSDISMLPCIHHLLTQPVDGNRNNSCYTIALFFKSQNLSEEDAIDTLQDYGGLSSKEVMNTVKSAYRHNHNFGCNENEIVQPHCQKNRCRFGYQKLELADVLEDNTKLLHRVKDEILTGRSLSEITLGHGNLTTAWGKVRKEEMIICAADAGIGKTAYAMYMLRENIKLGNKVLFCSLEMSNETLLERTIAEWEGTTVEELKNQKDKLDRRLEFFKTHSNMYSFYKSKTQLSVENIEKILKESIEKEYGLDLIIIDHLGCIKKNSSNAVWEEFARIAETLANIVKQYKIPIILLTHFNKGMAGASNKPRSINDIFGSSKIRDYASKLFQIWYKRNEGDDPDEDDTNPDKRTLFICHKNRFGDTKTVMLFYKDGMYTSNSN